MSEISTGRAESTQSRIKGKNVLKAELKKAPLVESVERVFNIAEHQDVESTGEIEDLIAKGRRWSDFVDKIWKENQNETYKLKCGETSTCEDGTTKYEVLDNNNALQHVVFLNPDLPPQCGCPKFRLDVQKVLRVESRERMS